MNPPQFSQKIVITVAEKDLPPPAPLRFRAFAFLADGILATVGSAIAVKFLLPVFSPDGFSVFAEYYHETREIYEAALTTAAANGNADPAATEALNAISERALRDEKLASFFEVAYTISFLTAALYFVLSEFFLRGQTLGKKIFGLRTVIFGTPLPPLFLQILSRSFWKAILLVPAGILLMLLGIANATVTLFSRRHRGWHDKLARTEVIDARALENRSPEK